MSGDFLSKGATELEIGSVRMCRKQIICTKPSIEQVACAQFASRLEAIASRLEAMPSWGSLAGDLPQFSLEAQRRHHLGVGKSILARPKSRTVI